MRVRRANPDDASFIAETYAPFVIETSVSFETAPPDTDEIARRMELAGDTYPWLIAEADGARAGYAYASQHRTRAAYKTSVDTAIYLAGEARGQGIATPLYDALFDVLTAQNYVMAFAGVTIPNHASEAFHRKAGFKQIARYPNVGFKNGAWRDVIWFARELAKPSTPPAPLKPLTDTDLGALLA